MRKHAVAVAALVVALSARAGAQQSTPDPYPTMAPVAMYRMSDARSEIALARSAAPPSISAHAEVLVLGPTGYVSAAKGTNGFVCFVERSWTAGFNDPEFWNPKDRAPNCFNAAAARTELPRLLARTKWALEGDTRQQMMAKAKAAAATHMFKSLEPGAFSFMLSKKGYLGDAAAGPWLPHVMFFLPHGSAAAWGASKTGSPIIGQDGEPYETTILLVPVRRWSDGTPAPPPPPLHVM